MSLLRALRAPPDEPPAAPEPDIPAPNAEPPVGAPQSERADWIVASDRVPGNESWIKANRDARIAFIVDRGAPQWLQAMAAEGVRTYNDFVAYVTARNSAGDRNFSFTASLNTIERILFKISQYCRRRATLHA